VLAGCEFVRPERVNVPPDTAITTGPPEGGDASYHVVLAWSGEDPDGSVDRFEIAWEEPADWNPLTGGDSSFVVTADSCCGEPPAAGDSTASWAARFHHVFIRAVDDDREPDATPAARSFNAKTIAPRARIVLGPRDGGTAPATMRVELTGVDDDGVVVGYQYTLVTMREYVWDGQLPFTTPRFLTWADTLTYHPRPDGTYDDTRPARLDTGEVLVLSELPVLDDLGAQNLYLLGVRAVDDAGAVEPRLQAPSNARIFSIGPPSDGPRLFVRSEEISRLQASAPVFPALARIDMFAADISLQWAALPGPDGTRVSAFRFAMADTAEWSPWEPASASPFESRFRWCARPGPATFFVQAADALGAVSTTALKFNVFPPPSDSEGSSRTVLVVLDTDAGELEQSLVLPRNYPSIERVLADDWFGDFRYQVFETHGTLRPGADLLARASSVVWVHTTDVADGDSSVLASYGQLGDPLLAAYVAAGGNLFLLGVQPSQALRYWLPLMDTSPMIVSYPLIFAPTPADPPRMLHWGYLHLGLAGIEQTVANTNTGGMASVRLHVATSQVAGYPDLPFDPLTWPQGAAFRGFGHYDRGITPNESGETIYTVDDTGTSLGVRRLTGPSVGGNTVYLGLHPYWVERPAFRDLVRAVLSDFGETPVR
jgi:hypothetical protein